ncbi:MAG TPA: putative glycoside hydrolase [Chloroflexia bacterium]|nr:putative glycoside hydrolase [Chloroflexia bacterium]
MRNRRSPLGPGAKYALFGLGGLVVLFLLVQYIVPFFFGKVEAALPKQNNLEGAVVSASTGQPVTQATIKKADGSQLVATDAKGQFVINKLPDPTDKLVVSAPGYESAPLPTDTEAAKTIQLKPRVITGTLEDADTKKPIAGRLVKGGDSYTTTDESGKFTFNGLPDDATINVNIVGYATVDKTLEPGKSADVTLDLQSTTFTGSLTDSKSGKPVPNALVKSGDLTATTGQDGKFTFTDFKRDDSTPLTVRAPGYKIQTFKPSELAQGAKMDPFKVRAVYVPGILAINANYNDLFTKYWDMADRGEINAIVLGMKNDDDGLLWYNSQVPEARQFGLVKDKGENSDVLIDIPKLMAEAKKHNVYMIARFVVMRDPGLAKAKPEWAIKSNKTGKPWQDMNGLTWPNPFQPEVADYNASLAKELADLGFNEIQYDYIRFPTDGALREIQYKPDLSWSQLSDDESLREKTIDGVVRKAYDTLKTTNTFLSLDVFGMSLWREDDNNIGQQYNDLVFLSDYICPMVYPSHFDLGTLDQAKYPGHPGLYPGVIIEKSGIIANKLEAKLQPIAKYRPWLEDFSKTWGTPIIKNTPDRVQAQIQAAEDNGAWGWTLWNATGEYTTSVLAAWSKGHKL